MPRLRPMARKPLMHNYIYFETLEVGSVIWVCGKETSLFVAKSAFRDQVAGLLVPFYGLRGEIVLRERLLSHRDLIHDPRDRCRRGMAHRIISSSFTTPVSVRTPNIATLSLKVQGISQPARLHRNRPVQ